MPGLTGYPSLVYRSNEHKQHTVDGFTERYRVTHLVWFDQTDSVQEVIAYEKRLKHRKFEWMIALIEKENADWVDICESIL